MRARVTYHTMAAYCNDGLGRFPLFVPRRCCSSAMHAHACMQALPHGVLCASAGVKCQRPDAGEGCGGSRDALSIPACWGADCNYEYQAPPLLQGPLITLADGSVLRLLGARQGTTAWVLAVRYLRAQAMSPQTPMTTWPGHEQAMTSMTPSCRPLATAKPVVAAPADQRVLDLPVGREPSDACRQQATRGLKEGGDCQTVTGLETGPARDWGTDPAAPGGKKKKKIANACPLVQQPTWTTPSRPSRSP